MSQFSSNRFWALTRCQTPRLTCVIVLLNPYNNPWGWALLASPLQRQGITSPRSSLTDCGAGCKPPALATIRPALRAFCLKVAVAIRASVFSAGFSSLRFQMPGRQRRLNESEPCHRELLNRIIHDHQDSTETSLLGKPLCLKIGFNSFSLSLLYQS